MRMTRSPREDTRRRVLSVVRWPLGGIRTYLLYNYPILAEAGYRFTLVGPADDSFRGLCREVQSWENVEFVEAPLSGRGCKLRSTVRRLLRERPFDLIHSQGLTAGVEAVLANLSCGVPHVITSHDVIRPGQFAGLRGWLKRRVLGRILGRAHALVAVSQDACQNHLQYLPALRHGSCRVLTIPNGVDTARFSVSVGHVSNVSVRQLSKLPGTLETCPTRTLETCPTLRERLGVPDDVCLLGFLGRFMEQKGFLVLVDALERLVAAEQPPRFRLLAVGSGDYVREYRAEIASRPGVAGCITFVDHTPDITPILREIDLLVMPSLWEACGLLAIEAMCAGIPVLGSDCIGLREVLFGGPSAMVPAGDAAALAQGIRQAIEAPWKEKAAEYAPLACRRFDVRQGAGELLALFDQLRGLRARPKVQGSGFEENVDGKS